MAPCDACAIDVVTADVTVIVAGAKVDTGTGTDVTTTAGGS